MPANPRYQKRPCKESNPAPRDEAGGEDRRATGPLDLKEALETFRVLALEEGIEPTVNEEIDFLKWAAEVMAGREVPGA
ncbi:MAG TPA: hypothetical protein VJ739_06515 [Gemmataceae bacterium]|nr:hypothetical protein [Gemmataceae bacterium]